MASDAEQQGQAGRQSGSRWRVMAAAVTRHRREGLAPAPASVFAGIGAAAAAAVALSAPGVAQAQAANHSGVVPATPAVAVGPAPTAPASSPTEKVRFVGPAPARAHVRVVLHLRLRDAAGAEALARAVSDPASPEHGQFVTPGEFRARFAPSLSTVHGVSRFLTNHGLSVGAVPLDRTAITAEGSVASVQKAFQVLLVEYTVNGKPLIVASEAPRLPAPLASNVVFIDGLGQGSHGARPDHVTATPSPAFVNAGPCSAYWGEKMADSLPTFHGSVVPYAPCGYTPSQVQGLYDLAPVYAQGIDGRGQTIAIVDAFADPTLATNADIYSRLHGQGAYARGQLRQVATPSLRAAEGDFYCGAQDWYGEQNLDVEAAHTTAPGANILYVGAADCSDSSLQNALYRIVNRHLASIITNSWGSSGELSSDPSWDQLFVQAAAEGISVNFSSGDGGDEVQNLGSPAMDSPVDSPWVTAVGGTSAAVDANNNRLWEAGWGTGKATLGAKGWGPVAWDYGGGGGVSSIYTQPWYQSGVVPASISTSATGNPMRSGPDVAMLGDPNTGFLMGQIQSFPDGQVKYSEYRIGGTSLASPLMAGVEALANQAAGHDQGFFNPMLYRLAGTPAFNDILTPPSPLAVARVDYKNGVNGRGGLVTSVRTIDDTGHNIVTAPGYDTVTGNGTPDGAAFVGAFELGG